MSDSPPRLVLASASPRRREMLSARGLEFSVRPADIDESSLPDESPREYVLRLARAKAKAVADRSAADEPELVLAADTIVVLDGELLGKPRDEDDARRMLEALSGRDHEVLTGVAICSTARGIQLATVECTTVRFAPIEAEEIDWYVATGEPMDKAGAYAIQGLAAIFVDGIDGNHSNVVGLPLPIVYRLLRRVGYPILG